MASLQSQTLPVLRFLLPQLSQAASTSRARVFNFTSRQLSHPLLPALSWSIPVAVQLNVSSWISELWDSVLRAVPKKKTSHMKKRHRQMAGKALKDVTALNKCSACGNIKRAHLLCPYCVQEIRDMWANRDKGSTKQAEAK